MRVDEKTTVMISSKAGRLGNRLFQAAYFMGNALSQGYRLLNPSLGEYAQLFEGSARDPLCGYPEPWRDLDPEFAHQSREFLFPYIHLLGLVAKSGIVPGVTAIDIRRFDSKDDGDIDLNSETPTNGVEIFRLCGNKEAPTGDCPLFYSCCISEQTCGGTNFESSGHGGSPGRCAYSSG